MLNKHALTSDDFTALSNQSTEALGILDTAITFYSEEATSRESDLDRVDGMGTSIPVDKIYREICASVSRKVLDICQQKGIQIDKRFQDWLLHRDTYTNLSIWMRTEGYRQRIAGFFPGISLPKNLPSLMIWDKAPPKQSFIPKRLYIPVDADFGIAVHETLTQIIHGSSFWMALDENGDIPSEEHSWNTVIGDFPEVHLMDEDEMVVMANYKGKIFGISKELMWAVLSSVKPSAFLNELLTLAERQSNLGK